MLLLKKLFIPLLIMVAALGAVVLLSLAKPAPQQQAPEQAAPPKVTAILAEPQRRLVSVTTQGTVQPKTEITLVAQVGGQVTEVSDQFVGGGFFHRGDVLLRLDERDYRIAVVQAQSRVAEAEKALATERGQARQAKREWRDLGNEEGNALFLRKPQLRAAEAALEAARADLEQARINLERTVVVAPFDGRVRAIDVNLGQYVSTGAQLATVFATELVEVRLPLTASQTPLLDLALHPGENMRLPVSLSASFNGKPVSWQGALVRTEASIDPRSRVLYGVVEVADPLLQTPPLMVGLFVSAEVTGKVFEGVIEVPREALYEKDNLLLLDEHNRLHIAPVDVLQVLGEKALVGGVSRGQVVLLERPGYVVEGMTVAPVIANGAPQS